MKGNSPLSFIDSFMRRRDLEMSTIGITIISVIVVPWAFRSNDDSFALLNDQSVNLLHKDYVALFCSEFIPDLL